MSVRVRKLIMAASVYIMAVLTLVIAEFTIYEENKKFTPVIMAVSSLVLVSKFLIIF